MRDARRREAGDGEPRVERRRGVRESEGEVRRRREEEMAERGGAREHREAVGGELEGGASWSLQRKGRGGEVYRLYDVGGQRNERRKWIHLFEGVNAVIFCAAISEYDQMLFEDETQNRMMETKELFDWVLKQRCFEKTPFMLFLNKFDIFEEKIQKVPLTVCEWFKDYQPLAPGKQEVEHAYEFVKKKFEELYFQSSKPDRVDRVFKIFRTTALDQKLVKKTFKLIDESMRRSREGA